ncbi:uncharacterized protein PV09_09280 [Verruconis gallopava]|uniref:Uncharacterized protein n=1 Tax=Verruconis gallopava TaxID=253628 RepID=A0A0D1XA40_9PEZI|nr:uncharacterized protein PV09_09280 [Verruconis gallopava]KIV99000.1 hypothetical protein PV09_09280 [Verruconis gallopava]
MLKTFLEGGRFEDDVEEEIVTEDIGDEGCENNDEIDEVAVEVKVAKNVKKDPLATIKRATSHPAYAKLKVVD